MNTIEKECRDNGCCIVSEGTLKDRDLFISTMGALSDLNKDRAEEIMQQWIFDIVCTEDRSQINADEWVSWLLEDIHTALNEYSPTHFYFGAQEGDGACFGFWKIPHE